LDPRRLFHPRGARSVSRNSETRLHNQSKKALRCVKRISNANIFEAVISRDQAQGRLIDELLSLFGGRTKPVMAHLIESGKLTVDDVKEAEQALRKLARKDKSK
jgi:BlaI family penicillinase repressor